MTISFLPRVAQSFACAPPRFGGMFSWGAPSPEQKLAQDVVSLRREVGQLGLQIKKARGRYFADKKARDNAPEISPAAVSQKAALTDQNRQIAEARTARQQIQQRFTFSMSKAEEIIQKQLLGTLLAIQGKVQGMIDTAKARGEYPQILDFSTETQQFQAGWERIDALSDQLAVDAEIADPNQEASAALLTSKALQAVWQSRKEALPLSGEADFLGSLLQMQDRINMGQITALNRQLDKLKRERESREYMVTYSEKELSRRQEQRRLANQELLEKQGQLRQLKG